MGILLFNNLFPSFKIFIAALTAILVAVVHAPKKAST